MSRPERYKLVVPAAAGNGTAQVVRYIENKYVQISGTFGTGVVSIEGRLDPDLDYLPVVEDISAADEWELDAPYYDIRIVTTAGDASGIEAVVAGKLIASEG